MRQGKTISFGEYVIDNRKKEDILDKIRELAAAYTPEWQFDGQNPDIGSVLALLFADQMQENIRRYNLSLERDYVEFMNLPGLSLRSACPAHSIVLFEMMSGIGGGRFLPAGTRLLAEGAGNPAPVFETSHDIYLTEVRIKCMFMASGITGKVIPLKGDFAPIEYVSDDGEEGTADSGRFDGGAFTLFDFSGEGYGKNGLVLYHTNIFDGTDSDIRMEIQGAGRLMDEIVRGNYRLSCYGKKGFCPITELRMEEDGCLVFRKEMPCRKVQCEGNMYSAMLLEPYGVSERDVTASDIRFGATGVPTAADYVLCGAQEAEAEDFYPFGRALSLFAEFSVGHRYFENAGARVTLTFALSFEDIVVKMPEEKEEGSLKIIKKRPRRDAGRAVAEVYAQEVSIAYYNGTGWRKLTTEKPADSLFRWGEAGVCTISFVCPADWHETEAGSYTGRCIRIRLVRADDCYYQPAIHHCPVIRQMRVSYDYSGRYVRPQKLVAFQGSRRREITEQISQNRAAPIFLKSSHQETALYLGFDRKPREGPVGLLFRIKEDGGERNGRLCASYSTRAGFSKLKLTDHTDGLRHTGNILFFPPEDMAEKTIEGQEAYWIRITDEDFTLEKNPDCRPVIEEIALNAAEVDNIETLPEEEYYIDACEPNMVFPVRAVNILQADVWVNETAGFSEGEMRRFMREHPTDTRAEYDRQGNICEFYVKWREVDHFDRSLPGDRHFVLDRVGRRICFGDGVNVRIPRNTAGPAFKMVVRCCDGAAANVPAGSINDVRGNRMFVKNIRSPLNAFGGMDMETAENALRRGTAMFNSRSRLVSVMDYERETLDFSRGISQARIVTDVCRDGGRREGALFVVVLMEDYKDGSASFISLKKNLKEHLLTRCELTVTPEQLEIVEPLFVEISVEVWIRVADADNHFEMQQNLVRMLTDYLDPVKNGGWEIGGGITENQIRLRLNREKESAMIRRIMVSGRYRDREGWHETELTGLGDNPYMLAVSGRHRIHFI